ncbi:GGDEF domain-containing protein [Deinococcus sp. KSM4-11]|uniref:GGDEF domain-containing protein n=1 Tax=Deinococcus sp. KSM4-11 TaxID=2568654 RepID=UPI001454CF76|nr:GGDEF domain-containing protein [Deinococcus sp. KSM4-11]
MGQDLPDDLFEFFPLPTLCWPATDHAAEPQPNLAYRRTYPPGALPGAGTWADGHHIQRLLTQDGHLRFSRVHLTTLPGGTRLATIEDVHEYHQDALTGLLDRRALQHDLRTQTPGSVTLLDIDHFKAVNDTLGHAAGDDVLCALAALVATVACTCNGHAYRVGGDEFLLHTPRPIPADQLDQLHGQFRLAISRLGVPRGQISSGMAHAPRDGNTIRHLILHADAQLGEHKHHRQGAVHRLNLEPEPTPHRPAGWTHR